MQLITERIRLHRRVAKLTQADAARRLGVSTRTYARWESGTTLGYLSRVDELAMLFGVTMDALLIEAAPAIEERVTALELELIELRRMLLDPRRVREAAAALAGA
jgi:transcriptional regulator with XRE-family HTH domain